ncbi:hypothetical protein G6F35_010574 [Rhizopus arrhizus]|nr:hypothetical protein G6F35_010574 [Rhizopus arrhizus]
MDIKPALAACGRSGVVRGGASPAGGSPRRHDRIVVGNHNTQFPASVFKAYDIRGTVPDLIDATFARALGGALAARARAEGVQTLVVGRDGRLSSPMLSTALQEGMLEGGVDTLDIGMVPTPLVYFATHIMQCGSGVAITGSHNPPKYNGFKMMIGGRALYGDDVQALSAAMNGPAQAPAERAGVRRQLDLVAAYIARVASGVKLARPMKIAIDCGNGVAGAVAPQLFRALGCEVTELFCEVDGTFPNHHPDPAEPKNLQDLIKCVAESDCELGLAFDGDGDRLGVVTKSGQIIWPDRQLVLFARDPPCRPVRRSRGRRAADVEDRPLAGQGKTGRNRRAAGWRKDR